MFTVQQFADGRWVAIGPAFAARLSAFRCAVHVRRTRRVETRVVPEVEASALDDTPPGAGELAYLTTADARALLAGFDRSPRPAFSRGDIDE